MIEHTSHTDAPESSPNRSFGFVFVAVFAIIGLWPLMRGGPIRTWSLLIAGVLFAIAVLRPTLLATLNKWWTKLGLLLGLVVSPVALGIVFYFTVMPIGLILRAFGKDPLRLKSDRHAASYWIHRTPPAEPDESMKNQF